MNLFLFGIGRSPQPPRPAADRIVDGRPQRRQQLPMLQLHYLISAWAGSVRDEHQLIGDVLTNLRAALDWSRERGDIELALTLVSSLQPLWIARG